MMISASVRTDIPAFYSEWFINRIRQGFVVVRNPYYPETLMQYELNPEVVDLISFHTKNPGPMLKYMDELKPYNQYWSVTITGYGKDIEPNVPDKDVIIQNVITLSNILGKHCIEWRYDPIFFTNKYNMDWHKATFEKMCQKLQGHIKHCGINFINIYEKVKRNFPEVKPVTDNERAQIAKALSSIGAKYNITLQSCPFTNLEQYGVNTSPCMSKEDAEAITGYKLKIPAQNSKGLCPYCVNGIDIGEYNSCFHLCKYCYANYNNEKVNKTLRKHDPYSPLLLGGIQINEAPHIPKQKSWKYIDKKKKKKG